MNYNKYNFRLAVLGTICYGLGWYTHHLIYYFFFGFCFGQIWVNYRKEKKDRENNF